jgi:hypothetical protein
MGAHHLLPLCCCAVLCCAVLRRRRYEKEKKRNAPPVPNAEGIPPGTYVQSCNGCSMDEEGAHAVLSQPVLLQLARRNCCSHAFERI